MRNHKTFWIDQLQADAEFGGLRFKKLDINYPPFEIDADLIDVVDMDEFYRNETERMPLHIGSQFGVCPNRISVEELHNGDRIYAILAKSLLSGHVAGLSIMRYIDKQNSVKIKYFPNSPLEQ